MKLAETSYDNSETGCCAPLDVPLWNEQELTWHDKPFMKDHVRAFLHIPLNFGPVVARDHAAIEAAEAYPDRPFWLSDESSAWGSDLYTAIEGDVPGAEVEQLSGTFLTKVFEGPYHKMGTWVREMGEYVRSRGHEMEKVYFYYAICPKCAKHFGRNQVVLVAKVH